jgi:hypothetical protein
MSAPLTKSQKRYLSQLARDAWLKAPQADGQDVNSWRRDQVAAACGKWGLRCCSQDDYGAVRGHFLNLLGQPGKAFKVMVHGDPAANQRRVVEWKIMNRLTRLGEPISYGEGIIRQMTRGAESLTSAPTKTLWKVFYALNKECGRRGLRTTH